MRKNIVAGNWKMNTNLSEGRELTQELNDQLKNKRSKSLVIIAPPFTHLSEVASLIDKNTISLSAQDCAAEDSGAYTGEVSAAMLASIGVEYVILGHSERRAYYGDTNDVLRKKVKQALNNHLRPIFCIGEVLEEREKEIHFDVVKEQISKVLFELTADDFSKLIIAYEPVWAIGTGKTASSQQAQEIHAFIRQTIKDKYNESIAEDISILYGGSCKPTNAKELFSQKDVDGGLIGGASLFAKDFSHIINAFN